MLRSFSMKKSTISNMDEADLRDAVACVEHQAKALRKFPALAISLLSCRSMGFFLICTLFVAGMALGTTSLSQTLEEQAFQHGKLFEQDPRLLVVQRPHPASSGTASKLLADCLANQSECDFAASGEGWFEKEVAHWAERAQVQVVSSAKGLRSCGIDHSHRQGNQSVVTLLLHGHLRTFQTVNTELHRFLSGQPVDVDTIVVTWETIESRTAAWWKNASTSDNGTTTSHLARSDPNLSGLPLVLAGIRSWDARHPDRVTHASLDQSTIRTNQVSEYQKYLFAGAYHLMHLCLGRNRSPYDVVVKTRPDVIYSHRVDLVALRRFFQSHPLAAFCVTHQDNGTFRYDPNELTWFTSVQGTHTIFQHFHGDRLCPETKLRNSVLGFYYSSLLTHCAQLDILYIQLDFAIRIVRPNNKLSGTLPRGHASFFATGNGMIDITRDLVCVRPRLNEMERCLEIYGIPCCGKVAFYPDP